MLARRHESDQVNSRYPVPRRPFMERRCSFIPGLRGNTQPRGLRLRRAGRASVGRTFMTAGMPTQTPHRSIHNWRQAYYEPIRLAWMQGHGCGGELKLNTRLRTITRAGRSALRGNMGGRSRRCR